MGSSMQDQRFTMTVDFTGNEDLKGILMGSEPGTQFDIGGKVTLVSVTEEGASLAVDAFELDGTDITAEDEKLPTPRADIKPRPSVSIAMRGREMEDDEDMM